MNRKERRTRRAQERKAGEKAVAEGRLPQAYYDDIEEAARIIFEWVKAQPAEPALRWVEQKDDGVFVAAALDVGAHYLADSPDAFALLAWLDEKTDRKLSLNQATWALRRCRALPMPDGSYYGVKTVKQSAAMTALMGFGKNDQRVPSSACPHCGVVLDAVSGAEKDAPTPGCMTVCIACFGFALFGEDMRLLPIGPDELATLPDGARAQLEEMASILRHYRMTKVREKGSVPEA